MITELFPPRIEGEIRGKSFRGEPRFVLTPEMGDAFRIAARPDSCFAEGGKTGLLYARDLLADLTSKHGGIPCAEYRAVRRTGVFSPGLTGMAVAVASRLFRNGRVT